MGIRSVAILVLVVLASTVQAARDEAEAINPSSPTTLYFHVLNALEDFPVNTQEPEPHFVLSDRAGLATNSLCFGELAGVTPLMDKEFHTMYGYNSPDFVDYDYSAAGNPRVHIERGMAFDALLDGNVTPIVHWYLATGAGVDGASTTPDQAPLAVPNVVVRATMREGDAISVNDAAYREGSVIMAGQTAPTVLAADLTEGAEHTMAEGRHVYHFAIPMTYESTVIPRLTGFNIQVEVFVENPRCNGEGDYIMPNAVSVFSADGHRPRLELAILNPIKIDYLYPRFLDGDLVVSGAVMSPWGNYDFNMKNSSVAAIQGDERIELKRQPQQKYYREENAAALDLSWILINATEVLKPGPVTVEMTFETVQGYRATSSVDTSVADTNEAPGVPLAALLGALALAGMAYRRRD